MNSSRKDFASIVIRTRNEEKWISHCLQSVFGQEYKPGFEVIIVDNKSTDYTAEIVKRFPIKMVLEIDEYLPGKALNFGIKKAKGEFIVCLSSHCVPKNASWLKSLLINFSSEKVAGVYGRQIPVAFSHPADVRDMYITFGLDRRIQKKDTFFHNANSAIRNSILHQHPFDDKVTNIEDRLWAKTVIDHGYEIIYDPDAEVFHHHGIHQTQDSERIRQTFTVLNEHEKFSIKDSVPDSMNPENRSIACIIPIPRKISEIINDEDLKMFLSEIRSSKFIKTVHVLYDEPKLIGLCESLDFDMIQRSDQVNASGFTLDQVLQWGLETIEEKGFMPDVVLYTNPIYLNRPEGLFDELISDICYKGLDTVFPGFIDYTNYWIYDEKKGYHQVGEGWLPRGQKHPIYKALFGLGCVSTTNIIRQGSLTGKEVGIVPVEDLIYTLRVDDPGSKSIIKSLKSLS